MQPVGHCLLALLIWNVCSALAQWNYPPYALTAYNNPGSSRQFYQTRPSMQNSQTGRGQQWQYQNNYPQQIGGRPKQSYPPRRPQAYSRYNNAYVAPAPNYRSPVSNAGRSPQNTVSTARKVVPTVKVSTTVPTTAPTTPRITPVPTTVPTTPRTTTTPTTTAATTTHFIRESGTILVKEPITAEFKEANVIAVPRPFPRHPLGVRDKPAGIVIGPELQDEYELFLVWLKKNRVEQKITLGTKPVEAISVVEDVKLEVTLKDQLVETSALEDGGKVIVQLEEMQIELPVQVDSSVDEDVPVLENNTENHSEKVEDQQITKETGSAISAGTTQYKEIIEPNSSEKVEEEVANNSAKVREDDGNLYSVLFSHEEPKISEKTDEEVDKNAAECRENVDNLNSELFSHVEREESTEVNQDVPDGTIDTLSEENDSSNQHGPLSPVDMSVDFKIERVEQTEQTTPTIIKNSKIDRVSHGSSDSVPDLDSLVPATQRNEAGMPGDFNQGAAEQNLQNEKLDERLDSESPGENQDEVGGKEEDATALVEGRLEIVPGATHAAPKKVLTVGGTAAIPVQGTDLNKKVDAPVHHSSDYQGLLDAARPAAVIAVSNVNAEGSETVSETTTTVPVITQNDTRTLLSLPEMSDRDNIEQKYNAGEAELEQEEELLERVEEEEEVQEDLKIQQKVNVDSAQIIHGNGLPENVDSAQIIHGNGPPENVDSATIIDGNGPPENVKSVQIIHGNGPPENVNSVQIFQSNEPAENVNNESNGETDLKLNHGNQAAEGVEEKIPADPEDIPEVHVDSGTSDSVLAKGRESLENVKEKNKADSKEEALDDASSDSSNTNVRTVKRINSFDSKNFFIRPFSKFSRRPFPRPTNRPRLHRPVTLRTSPITTTTTTEAPKTNLAPLANFASKLSMLQLLNRKNRQRPTRWRPASSRVTTPSPTTPPPMLGSFKPVLSIFTPTPLPNDEDDRHQVNATDLKANKPVYIQKLPFRQIKLHRTDDARSSGPVSTLDIEDPSKGIVMHIEQFQKGLPQKKLKRKTIFRPYPAINKSPFEHSAYKVRKAIQVPILSTMITTTSTPTTTIYATTTATSTTTASSTTTTASTTTSASTTSSTSTTTSTTTTATSTTTSTTTTSTTTPPTSDPSHGPVITATVTEISNNGSPRVLDSSNFLDRYYKQGWNAKDVKPVRPMSNQHEIPDFLRYAVPMKMAPRQVIQKKMDVVQEGYSRALFEHRILGISS